MTRYGPVPIQRVTVGCAGSHAAQGGRQVLNRARADAEARTSRRLMLERAREGSLRGFARLRLASALLLAALLSLTAETMRWRKSGQWPSLKDTVGNPPSLAWGPLDRLADKVITFPPSVALAAVAMACACVGLRTFYRSERVIRRLEGTATKGPARRTT